MIVVANATTAVVVGVLRLRLRHRIGYELSGQRWRGRMRLSIAWGAVESRVALLLDDALARLRQSRAIVGPEVSVARRVSLRLRYHMRQWGGERAVLPPGSDCCTRQARVEDESRCSVVDGRSCACGCCGVVCGRTMQEFSVETQQRAGTFRPGWLGSAGLILAQRASPSTMGLNALGELRVGWL